MQQDDDFWNSIDGARVHIYNVFHKRKLGSVHSIYNRASSRQIDAEYVFAIKNDIRYNRIMLIWWRSLTAAQRADIMQAYSDLISQNQSPDTGIFWHAFLERLR